MSDRGEHRGAGGVAGDAPGRLGSLLQQREGVARVLRDGGRLLGAGRRGREAEHREDGKDSQKHGDPLTHRFLLWGTGEAHRRRAAILPRRRGAKSAKRGAEGPYWSSPYCRRRGPLRSIGPASSEEHTSELQSLMPISY